MVAPSRDRVVNLVLPGQMTSVSILGPPSQVAKSLKRASDLSGILRSHACLLEKRKEQPLKLP